MKNTDKKLLVILLGSYAAVLFGAIFYECKRDQVIKKHQEERTPEEKELFRKFEELDEEISRIKCNESMQLYETLSTNTLYLETKDREYKLRKLAASARSIHLASGTNSINASSGNQFMNNQAIYAETRKSAEIENVYRKSIEASRSTDVREKFKEHSQLLLEINAIRRRENKISFKELMAEVVKC